MRKRSLLFIVLAFFLAACSSPTLSPEDLLATSDLIRLTLSPAPSATHAKVPTKTPQPTITPIPTNPPVKIPETKWKTNAGYFTYDHDLWVEHNGWLFSKDYEDCMICYDCGHGVDPSIFYIQRTSEKFGDIEFAFELYIFNDTGNPGFTVVKWGPNQENLFEIQSAHSGWSCYYDALDVFWQSALNKFQE